MEILREIVLSDGTAPNHTVRFRFAGYSDRGAVRRINEDSYLAALPLFVVADGMGGHAFGDRASEAATAAFADAFVHTDVASPQRVLDTIRRANDAVLTVGDSADAGGSLSGTALSGV